MKFLRYGEVNNEKPAILDKEGNARDLSVYVKDISSQTINYILEELIVDKNFNIEELPIVDKANISRIGAPISGVGKFICIGLNYIDHAEESKMAPPPEPLIFSKFTSALCGPNDDIIIPPNSKKVDWEVELGVIIGKDGIHIDEADAMSHVAGFCVINDLSEREFQLERQGQWVKGKSYRNFGPIGPWLVTQDEINNVDDLDMHLSVNDKEFQNGNTKNLIFKIPHLISYLSQFCDLKAGDIISTGTPKGVGIGQDPQVYLKAGDSVVLSIAGLGEQRQKVINYKA